MRLFDEKLSKSELLGTIILSVMIAAALIVPLLR